MEKAEILKENAEVVKAIELFNKDSYNYPCNYSGRRLRSCTATVYESDKYIMLKSYNTIVAFIDKETEIFYDVLRYVYGYTATSAQHIAKFRNDYGRDCKSFRRYYSA